MFLRGYQKFFSSLLLIPVAFLLISCCCLKADAAVHKSSKCSSCPQNEKSHNPSDCPHAKLKAIVGADSFDLNVAQFVLTAPVLLSLEPLFFQKTFQPLSPQYLDTSQQHSSVFPKNPILRL